MDRHIACLQIPAFRIALARAADSALRNRPVAVAPTYTPRALIREISTEAFHEGLQPGIPVDLARLICPGLQLIPPDPSLTHAAHRELQHRISSFAPTAFRIPNPCVILVNGNAASCIPMGTRGTQRAFVLGRTYVASPSGTPEP